MPRRAKIPKQWVVAGGVVGLFLVSRVLRPAVALHDRKIRPILLLRVGGGQLMSFPWALRFKAMQRAAAKEGIRLNPVSGYRGPFTQARLYLKAVATATKLKLEGKDISGLTYPPTAPPGKSNHGAGDALDIDVRMTHDQFLAWKKTPEFLWLRKNATRFGFRALPSEAWHISSTGR